MRFRFCGDDDCPDWILAQINILSRMNLSELTQLIQIVAESLIKNINIQEAMRYFNVLLNFNHNHFSAKIAEVESSRPMNVQNTDQKIVFLANNISQISDEAKLGIDDCKATIAAINFILLSSIKNAVSESYLSNELQQIGLPHKHALALCRIYSENVLALRSEMSNESLKGVKLKNYSCSLKGSDVFLNIEAWNPVEKTHKKYTIQTTKDHMDILISDLKEAYERMESTSIS